MPNKEKLKNPSANPRTKAKYKVNNWTDYNKSLRKRGAISLYFPKGDVALQFVNRESYIPGFSGQQATYKPAYIELMFTLYRLFGWGLRQITGYFEDLWQTKKLEIPVPSFGHLSDLFADLPLKIRQFCETLKMRMERRESIDLILDSTGLRFGKASHWYETKYGRSCITTPWRKMHLSMDPEMNMHGLEITDFEASDIGMMDTLIPKDGDHPIGKVIADGAYYSIEGRKPCMIKVLFPSFLLHLMLWYMEKKIRTGMIILLNTLKKKEQSMRFIKSMGMENDRLLKHKFRVLSGVSGQAY